MAGSVVLYLTERFGLPKVIEFFRTSQRGDSLDVVDARMREHLEIGVTQAEAGWLAMLRD